MRAISAYPDYISGVLVYIALKADKCVNHEAADLPHADLGKVHAEDV